MVWVLVVLTVYLVAKCSVGQIDFAPSYVGESLFRRICPAPKLDKVMVGASSVTALHKSMIRPKSPSMTKAKQKIANSILFERIKGQIPNAEILVRQAVDAKIGQRHDVENFIRENFSDLVEELQIDAYNLYLANEKLSAAQVIRKSIAERLPEDGSTESVLDVVADSFGELDKFFLSLTQSRRARAGTAFQEVMSILLRRLGYPFVAQPVLDDSKPDYVMPSGEWYKHNATDCIILTLKRTLRERWRQVPTEGNSGSTFFLATIDEKVPGAELEKMKQLNVRMVVPKRLKVLKYSAFPAVISFEYFFEYFLDPAMKRWKTGGAI